MLDRRTPVEMGKFGCVVSAAWKDGAPNSGPETPAVVCIQAGVMLLTPRLLPR